MLYSLSSLHIKGSIKSCKCFILTIIWKIRRVMSQRFTLLKNKKQYSKMVRGKKSLEIRARKKHSEKHKDNIDNVEFGSKDNRNFFFAFVFYLFIYFVLCFFCACCNFSFFISFYFFNIFIGE